MAIANFIPEVFAQEVLSRLEEQATALQLCTTKYEGEIQNKGDKIHIQRPQALTVKSYSGSDITLEDPSDERVTLTIDEADYVAAIIDDTDQAKSPYDLANIYMAEGNTRLVDSADQKIYRHIAENAHANNTITTVTLTASNIVAKIREARKLLSKSKVSNSVRKFLALTADEIDFLLSSDEFKRDTQLGDTTLLNGQVGRIYGFDIIETENVYTQDPADITSGQPVHKLLPFGVVGATAFANAMPPGNVKQFEPEKRFASAFKALHLYGKKVLDAKQIGLIKADTGTVGTG